MRFFFFNGFCFCFYFIIIFNAVVSGTEVTDPYRCPFRSVARYLPVASLGAQGFWTRNGTESKCFTLKCLHETLRITQVCLPVPTKNNTLFVLFCL